MPQTGDEDGLELGEDGSLRVRKATTTQRGSVLASVTAAANTVPQAGEDGTLDESWFSPVTDVVWGVGDYKASHTTEMPGWLLCNGAAVSRTTYAALFAKIGTTFGAGDGSTTFNLPDFRGRTFWGATDDQPLGSVIEAGLPDHTHSYTYRASSRDCGWADSSPMFWQNTTTTNTGAASKSNPIYGASDTVQPPAISVNIFIKY